MKLELKQNVHIQGTNYIVTGIVTYENKEDHCQWTEYRLKKENGKEAWLSIDDTFREYSLSEMCYFKPDFTGFHKVDDGKAVAQSVLGNIDVAYGDRFFFEEYEDNSGKNTISVEKWDDETEYSEGHYIDLNDIIPLEIEQNYMIQYDSDDDDEEDNTDTMVVIKICFYLVIFLIAICLQFCSSDDDDYSSHSARQGSYGHRTYSGGGLSSGK